MNRIYQWWRALVEPENDNLELKWRGFALNIILVMGVAVITPLMLLNIVSVFFALDDPLSIVVMFAICVTLVSLLIISTKYSLPWGIRLFSGFIAILPPAIHVGWGVYDTGVPLIYGTCLLCLSLISSRPDFWKFASWFGVCYLSLVALQLQAFYTPPFFNRDELNVVTVVLLLTLITMLNHLSLLIRDRMIGVQLDTVEAEQAQRSRNRIATQVQESMLPNAPLHNDTYDVVGQTIPAENVGGDFFSYRMLSDDRLAVVVGDATGKGVSAALLMAITTGMVDSLLPFVSRPAELLDAINQRLTPRVELNRRNVACTVAFFEQGKLTVANAGGIPPILCRADGLIEWLDVGGFPLGTLLTEQSYQEVAYTFGPDDKCLFISDGVIEAHNAQAEMLSFAGVDQLLADAPTHSAKCLTEYVSQHVLDFQRGVPQHDDVTVVTVQVASL